MIKFRSFSEEKELLIAILILILSFVFSYFVWNSYRKAKLEIKRLQNNLIALQTDNNNGLIYDQYLTKDEFKEHYYYLLKHLSDIEKDIKAKQIRNVTHVSNYYVDSSKTSYITNSLDTNLNMYNISYYDTCWGFQGYFNKLDNKVSIYKKHFSNELYIYEYWKRKNLFGWNILPRWGAKEDYRKVWTLCGEDTVAVKKIYVIKKEDFDGKN